MTPDVPTDDASVIARLERRLQRERQARLEAESLAETHTRALYEQTRRLELLEAVTAAANTDGDPLQAFQIALDRIASFTGWPVGHAWVAGPGGVLRTSGLWFDDGRHELQPFRTITRDMRFAPGVGLPGRTYAAGACIWVELLGEDPLFVRGDVARSCGLKSGFALPVHAGDRIVAVLEFFSVRMIAPDTELLRVMDQIGFQLGRVVERHNAQRANRRQHRKLARLAREASAQARAAEAASRAKSAFLAVTSHEVRTPLNAVLGMAQALSTQPMPQDQKALVGDILESGQMLLRLLNAVLDFSRIEAGQTLAHPEPVDLPALVDAVARMWAPSFSEADVQLLVDGKAFEGCRPVMCDRGKVEQTLVNLVSNALKFTPRGGEVRIRLSGPDQSGLAHFEVTDGGPGVPIEDRDRIFMAFEQTEEGRLAGGAGLGLAICAGNVRALGGQITADRDAEGRSRFAFSFQAPESSRPQDVQPSPGPLEEPDGRLSVLAAEDNASNRKVLGLLLSQLDVDLHCVEDGAAAVRAVSERYWDLVLMDANMPVMSGPDAVRAIRALGPAYRDLPIHMLTANVFEEDVTAYLRAGADGVLQKPIDVGRLFHVISTAGHAPPEKAA